MSTHYTILEGPEKDIEHAFEVEVDGDVLKLTNGTLSRDVDVRHPAEGRMHLVVEGRSLDVVYTLDAATATCWIGGHEFTFDVYTDRELRLMRQEQAAARDHDPQIVSPMAGKVISLAVELGATVERDDPLMVIEAMKMENLIRAPHAGTVEAIDVAPGDAVERGARLALLTPHEDAEDAAS